MCSGDVRRVKAREVRVCDVMACGMSVCGVRMYDVMACGMRVSDMWMVGHPMTANHRIGSEAVTQGMMTLADSHAHTHTQLMHMACTTQ